MTCGVNPSPGPLYRASKGRGRGKGRDKGTRMRPKGPPPVEMDAELMGDVQRRAEKMLQAKEKRRRKVGEAKETLKRKKEQMEQEK